MSLISIIIPVYNAETTLCKCLESIKSQTFTQWECILVDDGSTDRSGDICDEYAMNDCRFRIVHQKNHGVAMARQAGVNLASGVYSIHCDPDDYVDENMLQEMYSTIKAVDADILVADFWVEEEDGSAVYSKQRLSGTTASTLAKDILDGKVHGSLCNKLIPTYVYNEQGAKFFEGLNYCEDALIFMQLADKPLRVAHLECAYYHYVQNAGSATVHYTQDTYNQQLAFVSKVKDILSWKYSAEVRSFEFRSFYEAWFHGLYSKKEAREVMWAYRDQLFKPVYSKRDPLVKVLILLGADKLAKRIHA